jgi:glycerol kinase
MISRPPLTTHLLPPPAGLTQYSTASHIARAVLEAACYQTRAVLDVIEQESGVKLEVLKVDGESRRYPRLGGVGGRSDSHRHSLLLSPAGGVTNSDLAMQLQADIGGFKVCRPQMRE